MEPWPHEAHDWRAFGPLAHQESSSRAVDLLQIASGSSYQAYIWSRPTFWCAKAPLPDGARARPSHRSRRQVCVGRCAVRGGGAGGAQAQCSRCWDCALRGPHSSHARTGSLCCPLTAHFCGGRALYLWCGVECFKVGLGVSGRPAPGRPAASLSRTCRPCSAEVVLSIRNQANTLTHGRPRHSTAPAPPRVGWPAPC